MTQAGVAGRDMYLRYDDGPVQCFRVWDGARFLESQRAQGADHKDKTGKPAPYVVHVCTREQYLAEHRKR